MGRIDNRLTKVLQIVKPGTPIPIIVETLRSPSSTDIQELSSIMKVKRTSNIVNQVYGTVNEELVGNIANLAFVSVVYYDEPVNRFQSSIVPSISISKEDIFIPISDSAQFIGATDLHDIGITGKGIKVAVVDTGCNKNHPLLEGAIATQINIAKKNGAEYADINDGNGHGCAHPDTKVYTTFCGLNSIEDLYNRTNSEEIKDEGAFTKIPEYPIYTLSFSNNKLSKSNVRAIHKIPVDENIVSINGLKLTPWHPCFIFDKETFGIKEKRADEITSKDFLVSPNHQFNIQEYRNIYDIKLDESIGYILGVIAGDGCIHPRDNSIQISIGEKEVAEHVYNIMIKNNIKCNTPKFLEDRNYYSIYIHADFTNKISELNIKTSSSDVNIPEIIMKSPTSVIVSFLAGLIDTDGSVDKDRNRIRISTSSTLLINNLYSVLSLIGVTSYITKNKKYSHICKPTGNLIIDKLQPYHVSFKVNNIIKKELLKYMSCSKKISRLTINTPIKTSHNKSPLTNKELRKYLELNGIKFNQNHRCICCNEIYINNSNTNISQENLSYILSFFGFNHILNEFKLIEVNNIKREQYNGFFYDFTTDDSNYIAGITDMVFIHNTWCATAVGGRDKVIYSKHFEANIRMHGVAPECEIIAIKVLDDKGSGQTSWVIEGMEAAVDAGADIISMSLGSMFDGAGVSPDSKVVDEIVYKHNILCAVAAGNSFSNFSIGSPGGARGSLTVGSVAMKTPSPNIVSTFSSKGLTTDGRVKPDISAPGGNLLNIKEVLYGGTSGGMTEESGEDYIGIMGTSMATPHVAGCLALLLQAGMKRDRYVAEDLLGNTSDYSHPKDANTGWGTINVKKAYDYLVGNKNIVPISSLSKVMDSALMPLSSLIPQSEQTSENLEVRLPYIR